MRQITRVAARLTASAALGAGGVFAAPSSVSAQDAPPPDPAAELPAPAATSTITLPLLGAPVMVDVTTDAGGGLLDVTLSPSDTLTADPVDLKHVSFVNDGGSVRLEVAADGDAVGAQTWTGALCDGTTATVTFTVTESGEITDVAATPEADVRTTGKLVWVGFDWFQGVSIFAHGNRDTLEIGAIETIHCVPTVTGEHTERPGWPAWADWGDHVAPGEGGPWGEPGGADRGRDGDPGVGRSGSGDNHLGGDGG
jgi:hypothetical protein